MRIVSLNAWGGTMFDALARWLPGLGADVLCLQEVTRTPGLTGWTEFRDRERVLAQRADLFDDVRGLLPGHQGFFVASDDRPRLAQGVRVLDRAGGRHLSIVHLHGLRDSVATSYPVRAGSAEPARSDRCVPCSAGVGQSVSSRE